MAEEVYQPSYVQWVNPRLIARVWYCDDEVCDCTQPIIERLTPSKSGFPWVDRTRLWEGTFRSERTAEEALQDKKELFEAVARVGVEQKMTVEFVGVFSEGE